MSRGLMLALFGFLLLPVPYLTLTGPLTGLLLLARPATARERFWLAAALLATITSLGAGPGGTAQDLLRGGALAFSGLVPALAAFTRFGVLSLAALAAFAATGFVLALSSAFGIGWQDFVDAVRTQLLEAVDAFQALAPLPAPDASNLRAGAEWMAGIAPGLSLLGAMAGAILAGAVVSRVSPRPVGPVPGPFPAFRFNDQLIWGAVATLALALISLPGAARIVVENLLVIWAGLYAARGSAVMLALSARWPGLLRVALFLGAVLLLPYALAAALVTGLADTWFGFRQRRAPPPTEGSAS